MSARVTALDRLNDLLNGIPAERDAMSLSQFDGYVSALIVCPEIIPPSEWLPWVWGGEHIFETVDEAEEMVAAIMGRYNRVALELLEDPEAYVPVFEIDPVGEAVRWEPWLEGVRARVAAAHRDVGGDRAQR